MLSILIPTYNFNIHPLVKVLHSQVTACNIAFEILVYDDASTDTFDALNKSIIEFSHCTFKKLSKNIGRSAIRNTLAQDAQYQSLLFVDAGTLPKNDDFIAKYIELIDKVVVTGGMTHKKEALKKPFKLRWLYTKKRELNFSQNTQIKELFHSANFLAQKWVLKKHPFDESIKGYGYEDVLFYATVIKNNVDLYFVNNPVIHLADDTALEFIKKNENALKNLHALIKNRQLDSSHLKLTRIHSKLTIFKLQTVFAFVYKMLRPVLLLNLKSSHPSLILFDMYRLGYFCSIKQKD